MNFVRKISLVFLILLVIPAFLSAGLLRTEIQSEVITLPDTPILITSSEFFNLHVVEGASERIIMEYKNQSDKDIIGFAITYLYFDYFNDFLGRSTFVEGNPSEGGVELKVGEADDYNNNWACYDINLSYKIYVYVSKVRFADGTIWKADPKLIEAEVKKEMTGFDITSNLIVGKLLAE
ncbi:MAG: hypothetical protein JW737_05250 [Acidobacteria bacterium]|nr:hypothetical protein [Acidobacteriota bacterium]